ncbi:MAG TPA: Mov34/MPN/PAD-1 family protein [Phycisphaerae bacterium]|jgi:proteasome lid subunit RPN8/RPN11|nr:hypothetical protein [Phycisphaerae bacterium]HOB73529.1 Mov34/MPN/PAD-1 family protein [Phycisphaerae bacterium]HOJ54137.1 Mov34/MPN/PAD-1 family protein [Phycisphaerae bacterium]HOL25570.1 Mov34/MPN/PAD-1 family protein [Phycisphaerae bacterium]HPP20997.1 Mov34/MPN/PAD-1 family protein [Phycisphaerae bacterium]
MQSEYQYVASFHRAGQCSALTQVPLEVDWVPAKECVRLAGLRGGRGSQQTLSADDIVAEPIWHREAGEPYLAGLRIRLRTGSEQIVEELDDEYFVPAVAQAAARLVQAGALRNGEEFAYLVLAFRHEGSIPPTGGSADPEVEDAPVTLPIHAADFEKLLRTSTPLGINDPDDIPVFVPAAVLDEIVEHTRNTGPEEAGGILLGRMHRDPLDPQMLFFCVTAQVPGSRRAVGQGRFILSEELWKAADAAIRLRNKGEICAGWWHSHSAPAACADCPPPQREHCPLGDPNGFFSDADCALHRSAFPRAYNVGMVATHLDGEVWLAAFGWRKGRIVRRGLRVIGASRAYKPTGTCGCLVSGDVRNATPCK